MCVYSILGYCLLPVIGLAALRILFSLRGFFGMLVCGLCIFWSTFSCEYVNLGIWSLSLEC